MLMIVAIAAFVLAASCTIPSVSLLLLMAGVGSLIVNLYI